MSGLLYKRTAREDEDPLPVHDNGNEHDDVEMDDLGDTNDLQELPHDDANVPPAQIIYKRRRRENCFFLWALTATFFFIIMIVVSIAVHKSIRNMHWCCIGQEELSKCKEMSTAFRYKRFRPLFTCVDASSTDDCVHKIDQDIADVFTIPNFYLYKHRDKLYPIMAEDYANDGLQTYFVAIGLESNSQINLSRSGLSQKHALVTSDNFKLLHGILHQKNVISSEHCPFLTPNSCEAKLENDIGHCLQWHLASPKKQLVPQYIEASLPHVAFLDHITLHQITASSALKYELLCINGSRAPLTEYRSCNLLQGPSYSLVVSSKIRSDLDIDVPAEIVEVLHVAQLYFGPHYHHNFKMFGSQNNSNLLFQDRTEQLVPLRINCTSENYLGKQYLDTMANYYCAKPVNRTYNSCLLPQFN